MRGPPGRTGAPRPRGGPHRRRNRRRGLPAASLHRWGLAHRGYKRAANRTELARLAGELQAAAPWLDLAAFTPLCSSSDDAFDAVIAALTARAAHLGKTTQAPPEHRKAASTEGWITLPTTPLHTLHP